MPRTVDEILAHADELAARFEQYEPNEHDEVDVAAVSALRTAHHIVRSEPDARVLTVTVELCTLHLQEAQALEPLLAMLQFSDGAAAALVTSEPKGFEMSHLFSLALEDSAELIQWKIGDTGFEMTLSGEVPNRIAHALQDEGTRATLYNGWSPDEIDSWAVHAGGRSILDAVERGLALPQGALFACQASPGAPPASASSRSARRRRSAACCFFLPAALARRTAADFADIER